MRGAFLLLAGFVALAERLGLEVILGAFTAGVILSLIDRDALMTHPHFRTKLEGAGFGVFIPVFFVGVGLTFDLDALTSSTATLLRLPLFLAALLLVRGLPALLYRGFVGDRRAVAAGLLQATSLPFIVAASMIGVELGRDRRGDERRPDRRRAPLRDRVPPGRGDPHRRRRGRTRGAGRAVAHTGDRRRGQSSHVTTWIIRVMRPASSSWQMTLPTTRVPSG